MADKRWTGDLVRRARAHWGRRLSAGPLPCVRCGQDVRADDDWHVDHVLALALGGKLDDLTNQGVSHAKCNRSHGASVGHHKASSVRRAERRLRPWPGL